MMYIAICDDDRDVCAQIENILLEYAKTVCLKLEAEVYYDGESLLRDLAAGQHCDLLYLDIEMGKLNGVEVGRQIREVNRNYSLEIVYISGNDGYDRQLFDVQPLHFISKPIDPGAVIADLKLALERGKKPGGFFQYRKKYDTYRVPIEEILYFESLNRKIRMVTTKGEEHFYGSLGNVARSLAKYPFLQIHRSYLIHYDRVSILRYSEVVMSNGDVLPISKTKREEFRSLQLREE